ncbi:MAG: PLP-dependent aminotransferase family protein [Pseudomonadota bacterium]
MTTSKKTKFANIFALDRDGKSSLQEQLRRKIVDAIALGQLIAGARLPSSRTLSNDLGVSRNTVNAVYERLIADGHLVSRARSGIYVREERHWPNSVRKITGPSAKPDDVQWRVRITAAPNEETLPQYSPDWDKYPFPLLDGPFDKSLFPVAEWREASRRALAVAEVETWIQGAGDADDVMLVDEIRRKILPLRGINAGADQILVTTGAQQALYLVIELLVREGLAIGVEEPSTPEIRALLARRRPHIVYFDVDANGMGIDERLQECDIVFTSPGRQRPTGATMSGDRRDALIAFAQSDGKIVVEDDFQWEAGFAASDSPPLRGSSGGQSVIYAATLAQPLASAVRLGVLVAPAPVIRAARSLRRITTRQPALSTQRTFAHMLALGHYTSAMRRVEQKFADRMIALRDALNYYFPSRASVLPTQIGATAWTTVHDLHHTQTLAKAAETRGALIEPADGYFATSTPQGVLRLGVTGIEEHRIRDGVAAVAMAFHETAGPAVPDTSEIIDGGKLKKALSGASFLCKTVYGDPCTISLNRDGSMRGRAGFANEDSDHGSWWIDGDFWCRQWREWAYGEIGRYRVGLQGDQIFWFHPDGRLIDQAIIVRGGDFNATTKHKP